MAGVRVFAIDNRAATQVRWRHGSQASGGNEGVCLTMVLTWIQKTILNGNMVDDSVLRANMHLITLRQAAFKFTLRANRRAEARFRIDAVQDLLAQHTLRSLDTQEGELVSFNEPAGRMRAVPGYYLLSFNAPGRGHAFGFKFMGNDPSYFFDPNAGLFRYPNAEELEMAMLFLDDGPYEPYLGGSYRYWRLALG